MAMKARRGRNGIRTSPGRPAKPSHARVLLFFVFVIQASKGVAINTTGIAANAMQLNNPKKNQSNGKALAL
jgi:hypothetical protein